MPNNAPTTSVFLNMESNIKGVSVRRTGYKCSGINCCEYAVPALEASHTSWTTKDWETKREYTRKAEQAFMEEWSPWVGQEETLT
jgi:hypothetical protein